MAIFQFWLFTLIPYSNPYIIVFIYIVYVILLALTFALLFSLFCTCSHKFWMLPFYWTAFEWIRSIGPYANPNGLLGYSQGFNTFILPYASIGGVLFVSFLICSCNILLYLWITHKNSLSSLNIWGQLKTYILLFSFISALLYTPSLITTYHQKQVTYTPLNVAIIQGNHMQSFKLKRENRASIRRDYLSHTQSAITEYPVDLVIWPETFSPGFNLKKRSFIHPLNLLLSDSSFGVLFGTQRVEKEGNRRQYFNSAVLKTKEDTLFFDKTFLMPFWRIFTL